MMDNKIRIIPRKIWILWLQGLSEAPFIVRMCVESWIKENPNWEVVILDKDKLGEYIVLDLPEEKYASLPFSKQSNLIRLQLLSKYGGVWVDSTTLCMKPLDDWIDEFSQSGFFAFEKPGRDRMLSNWFLASEKGCPLILKLTDFYVSFFKNNTFNSKGKFKLRIIKCLSKILNRSEETTKYWFSPLITKILRVYPYFIFHYMFERLVSCDTECQIIWNNTTKISAAGPLKILRLQFLSPLNETFKNEIDEKRIPVYKLTWKYDNSKYSTSSTLYYLLEGRQILRP